MKEIITLLQILIAILLIGSILLQSRGAGLGRTLGGGGEFYHSRRGIEKVLQKTTIVLAFFFLVSSIALAVI